MTLINKLRVLLFIFQSRCFFYLQEGNNSKTFVVLEESGLLVRYMVFEFGFFFTNTLTCEPSGVFV